MRPAGSSFRESESLTRPRGTTDEHEGTDVKTAQLRGGAADPTSRNDRGAARLMPGGPSSRRGKSRDG